MIYKTYYDSPVGKMLLACSNNKLIGLWIEGQKYYLGSLGSEISESGNQEIFIKTKSWLDRYFDGKQPEINELELAPIGSDFRQTVWKLLCNIPYGSVTTYARLAQETAKITGRKNMSAQAIGGAVGHNPISVIIPCHRVVGSNGSLTGYAGGINTKVKLLELEKADMTNLYIPSKGTAL